jgi:hypothetical protein
MRDGDCATGQACACHGAPYMGGIGNTCVPGNCRVDSDCGPRGYCSPSFGPGCGGIGGYYCHTIADQCIDDSDCIEAGRDVCVYVTPANDWECQIGVICR